MRLVLTLACPQPLPFDHLPTLKGAFHRWSGHNPELHDAQSLYSLSWLQGGRLQAGQLHFARGARWIISAADPGLVHQVLAGVVGRPELGSHGLYVQEADLIAVPPFTAGEHRFELLSPVLVREVGAERGARQHLTFADPAATAVLTNVLRAKLRTAGLADEGVQVRFAQDEPRARFNIFQYNNIQSRVNYCPVLVTGSAEQLAFAWCVGIGQSTGIGCGALR